MSFPLRVRKLRKALGLTQRQFATALHISSSYVSEIEAGKKVPSDSLCDLIMARWDVANLWWEDETGEMFNKKADTAASAISPITIAAMRETDFLKLTEEEQVAIICQGMRQRAGNRLDPGKA